MSNLSGLPKPEGPYTVGVVDVESELNSKNVLFRLYYPAEKLKERRVRKARWMPENHAVFYTVGYGDYAGISPVVCTLLTPFTFGIETDTYLHLKPFRPSDGAKIPVVLFSHGLAGMRQTYSSLVTSLASHGYVVAALEHRDGSASVTMKNNYKETIRYEKPDMKNAKPGQSEDEFLLEFRQSQLKFRVEEVENTLNVLESINLGKLPTNLISESKDFDLGQFTGLLNIDNVSVMGHSFGAATAIATSQRHKSRFKASINLDPWYFPTDASIPLRIPSIFLNSETFHWKANAKKYLNILQNPEASKNNIVNVIKGTAHQDFSDLPALFPGIMKSMKLGGTENSTQSLLFTNQIVAEFMRLNGVRDDEKVVKIEPHPEYLTSKGFDRHMLFGDDAVEFLENIANS